MKVFRIILCFFIIFSLVSCGKNEFHNLYSFIDSYNDISRETIYISDFFFDSASPVKYTAVIGEEGNEIALEIDCDNSGNIYRIKISVIKNENIRPDYTQIRNFGNVSRNTLLAYCQFNENECEDILNLLGLNNTDTINKEGELTLRKENYYFVYYSTQLLSQLMIYNTYLHQIEPTEKPVSKPYYAEDFIIKETP